MVVALASDELARAGLSVLALSSRFDGLYRCK